MPPCLPHSFRGPFGRPERVFSLTRRPPPPRPRGAPRGVEGRLWRDAAAALRSNRRGRRRRSPLHCARALPRHFILPMSVARCRCALQRHARRRRVRPRARLRGDRRAARPCLRVPRYRRMRRHVHSRDLLVRRRFGVGVPYRQTRRRHDRSIAALLPRRPVPPSTHLPSSAFPSPHYTRFAPPSPLRPLSWRPAAPLIVLSPHSTSPPQRWGLGAARVASGEREHTRKERPARLPGDRPRNNGELNTSPPAPCLGKRPQRPKPKGPGRPWGQKPLAHGRTVKEGRRVQHGDRPRPRLRGAGPQWAGLRAGLKTTQIGPRCASSGLKDAGSPARPNPTNAATQDATPAAVRVARRA